MSKVCSKCKQEKPESEFYSNGKKGIYSSCRSCEQIRAIKYHQEHRAARLVSMLDWKRRNPGKSKASNRNAFFKRAYGITTVQRDALFAEHHNRCDICGATPTGTGIRGLHVDHDHDTGEVRGVLCSGCNVGLGSFKEDGAILSSALDYLLRCVTRVA